MSISDAAIAALWEGKGDKNFQSAHTGSRNFWLALKLEKGIDVPYRRVLSVLRTIEDYALTQRRVFKFPRQNYNGVRGFFQVVQADSMHVYKYAGFSWILVLVDVYTTKCFARPLKSTQSNETIEAFKSIFSEAGLTPQRIETDRGSEYSGATKAFFHKQKIFWAPKISIHKACFSEFFIYKIRRTLSVKLRQHLTDDWPSLLPSVLQTINGRYASRIGGLKPSEISGPNDDWIVGQAVGEDKFSSPTYEQQEKNQKQALESKSSKYLHRGDYVYLDKKRSPFQKSDETQRLHELMIVDSVHCFNRPCLYKLRTLLDRPVPGLFYRPQLTLTKKPSVDQLFKVESATRPKYIKGVKHYWVKWLGWPDSYSQWVPESQIQRG